MHVHYYVCPFGGSHIKAPPTTKAGVHRDNGWMGNYYSVSLKALSMHNAGANVVKLALGDPHLLEGGEGGEDGAANPYAVLALGQCQDVDLD